MAVYLDNAATSWPKSPAVLAAMRDYLETAGGNPGRSGHSMSVEAARIVLAAREGLAHLFNAPAVDRVVFTKNATEALNVVLFGILGPGDHAITTSMEHNAVMRPLRRLESGGTRLSVVPCDGDGRCDPDDIGRAITRHTKLIVMTHASNVSGTIMPVAEVGRLARKSGVLLAVDAAQTAGSIPIDVQADGIDLLAFTGHKALGGPQGTGGLVVSPAVELPPLLFGGTGSMSDSEYQPDFFPDRLESGTLNAIGIAGLGAAVAELAKTGVERVRAHKQALLRSFSAKIAAVPGVRRYGPADPLDNAGVISLNIDGLVCSETGLILDRVFGILTRTGLHCAPAAHRTLGTFPQGTVRFGISRFTSEADIDRAAFALAAIVRGSGARV